MAIKQQAKLVFSDLKKNSYKAYHIQLHEDGRVVSQWGAVGATMQECDYGCVGEAFYLKKIKDKEKKGYEHAKVLIEHAAPQAVSRGSLADIALAQIKCSSDVVKALIRRLADANVHKIVSSTSISFNQDTGLFQTPLGIVTSEGIDAARTLLSFFVGKTSIDAEYQKNLDAYLRIIPRNKGYKMRYEDIFPDQTSLQKESDLLDALQDSLDIVSKPQIAQKDKAATPMEQVFNLQFDVLADAKERNRLTKWFHDSNLKTHGYNSVQIEEIYFLDQPELTFDTKMGNIEEVFHGTGGSNVLSILKNGIKCAPPSTAAIAGKMWSNGTYGAKHSSKSLQYTLGRFNGSTSDKAYLFVADFAMGRMEIPRRGSGGPDLKKYDSVWAKPEHTGLRFDELVVYQDSQVKLKYLIVAK